MSKSYLAASEVEDARDDHAWGSLRWLANAEIGNAAGLTLGRVVIRRGHSNPRHCHPSCEELLYLLAGRLDHTLGDATFTLNPGDTLAIPAGVFHNAASTGDADAEMIVAYSTAHRDYLPEP
jgi:quercetin dioxygenase-like cupin family protein